MINDIYNITEMAILDFDRETININLKEIIWKLEAVFFYRCKVVITF